MNKPDVYRIIQDWIRKSDISRGYVTPTIDPYDYGIEIKLFMYSENRQEEVGVAEVISWHNLFWLPFTKKDKNYTDDNEAFLNNKLQNMYNILKDRTQLG